MVTNLFQDAIRTLDQMGIADVILPFFLIFVLVYATLQKTKILGDDKGAPKKFNIILALVTGLTVVFPHVLSPGSSYDVVPIINGALPWIMLLLVGIISLALLLGLFTGKSLHAWTKLHGWVTVIAVIAVVYIFLASSNAVNAPYWLRGWLYNSALVNTLIALIVFVIVISFITGDDKPAGSDSSVKKFFDSFKPD